ncbi:hypothetical protein JB92DRAFT_2833771 [Gautieria morchelliformis]|nr:hypothetical protein JB92DRAFT_2833771 [Gautieria morchelliformis]
MAKLSLRLGVWRQIVGTCPGADHAHRRARPRAETGQRDLGNRTGRAVCKAGKGERRCTRESSAGWRRDSLTVSDRQNGHVPVCQTYTKPLTICVVLNKTRGVAREIPVGRLRANRLAWQGCWLRLKIRIGVDGTSGTNPPAWRRKRRVPACEHPSWGTEVSADTFELSSLSVNGCVLLDGIHSLPLITPLLRHAYIGETLFSDVRRKNGNP